MSLFNENKGIPRMASGRIQRWALTLSAYDYKIKYREGKLNFGADALSRLPTPSPNTQVPLPGDVVLLMESLDSGKSPVSSKEIKGWTDRDPLLSHVRHCILTGIFSLPKEWSHYRHRSEFNVYERRKTELSVHNGCILWGARVVVPPQGRGRIIKELHEGHPGITVMKAVSRSHVWWPGLDDSIKECVNTCDKCQLTRNMPAESPLSMWEWPDRPWSRIHLDFAGPFLGSMFLIVIDARTKWLEVEIMHSIKAEPTIEKLRQMFPKFGIPDTIVSDNGATFTSELFQDFISRNGISHITSAPFKPASNGQAERAVQVFKNGLKKVTEGSLQTRVSRFLMNYRNSPQATTGNSPAFLMFGRDLRVPLSMVHPSLEQHVKSKQASQKQYHDQCSQDRSIQVNDDVFVRNYLKGQMWLPGKVVSQQLYDVSLSDGRVVRKHLDQLRSRASQEVSDQAEHPSVVDNQEIGGSGSGASSLDPNGHVLGPAVVESAERGVTGKGETPVGESDTPPPTPQVPSNPGNRASTSPSTTALRRSSRLKKPREVLDL